MRSMRLRIFTQWRPRSHLSAQEPLCSHHVTSYSRHQPRFVSISADGGKHPSRKKKTFKSVNISLPTILEPTEITEDDRKRIYIRGSGNIATFYAFLLRSRPDPPPVTLLVASDKVKAQFELDGKLIRMQIDDEIQVASGCDIELVGGMEAAGGRQPLQQPVRPIFNLVTAVRNRYVTQALKGIKHRLGRESNIITTHEGLGIIEEIYKKVFPDPASRPTFRIALCGVKLTNVPKTDTGLPIVSEVSQDHIQPAFTAHWDKSHDFVPGDLFKIRLGPLALVPGQDSSETVAQREQAFSYLFETLTSNQYIEVKEINQTHSLYYRYRAFMYEAIVGPICALYECTSADLMLDPERRTLVAALCEEMFNVVGRELTLPPTDTSKLAVTSDFIYRLVQFRSSKSSISNSMLTDCLAGRQTDVLALNGWLVARGKMYNPPRLCPLNEELIAGVLAKSAAQKQKLDNQKRLDWLAERADRPSTSRHQRVDQEDIDGLDHVERKRRAKEARQKEMLGKQEMPAHYASPEILPIGGS